MANNVRDILKIFNILEYKFYNKQFIKINNTIGYKIKTTRAINFYYEIKDKEQKVNENYEKELFLYKAKKEIPYKVIFLNKDFLFYKETKYLNNLVSAALDMSAESCNLFYFKHCQLLKDFTDILNTKFFVSSEIKSEVDEDFVKKWMSLISEIIKKSSLNSEINKVILPLEKNYYRTNNVDMYEVKESVLTLRTPPIDDKSIHKYKELSKLLNKDFEIIENVRFIFSFKRIYYAFNIF
jgi:hypothetical protein